MKKFLTILVVLGAIAVGGHYLAWNYIADKAETNFHAMIKDRMKYQLGTVDYTLVRSGYPTHISLTMKDITFSIPEMDMKLTSNDGAGFKVSVPFSLNADTFTFDIGGINYTASFEAEGEQVSMTFAIDKGNGVINFHQGSYHQKGQLSGMTIDISTLKEKTRIGIDLKKATFEETSLYNQDTLTSDINVKLNNADIVIESPKETVAFTVDEYIVKGGITDFPNIPIADVQKIIMQISENAQKGQDTDAKDLKNLLTVLVKGMAKHGSVLHLDEITYKLSNLPEVGSFGTTLNLNLRVSDAYIPYGDVGVKLDGLKNVANGLMKQNAQEGQTLPPMALAFIQAGTLELSATADETGMVIFNGMPVFQLPPLDKLIAQIPDTITAASIMPAAPSMDDKAVPSLDIAPPPVLPMPPEEGLKLTPQ